MTPEMNLPPDLLEFLRQGRQLAYDPMGMLVWLPVERRYGIWDPSHCKMIVFGPDVTWERIAPAPAAHLNAGWMGRDPQSPPTEYLVPWPDHPYGDRQVYEPQPA